MTVKVNVPLVTFFTGSELRLAVPVASVQKFRDWDVVFLRVDNQYEPRPVTLGRSDGQWVEIVGGLRPGDTYVKENSFIIKAELQKSAATHSH